MAGWMDGGAIGAGEITSQICTIFRISVCIQFHTTADYRARRMTSLPLQFVRWGPRDLP